MGIFGSICFMALLLQSLSAQCIRNPLFEFPIDGRPEFSFPFLSTLITPFSMGCLNGFGPTALAASTGSTFFTTSFSPILPTGLFINSENYFEGAVTVAGQVPFLGSISLEGALPSAGTGAIVYGCGNGDIFMLSEDVAEPVYDYGYPDNGYYDYGYPDYHYDRSPFPYDSCLGYPWWY